MKSSDLKVVAIILSIALFFTIITSNAVSIASVVILAKGGSSASTASTYDSGAYDANGTTFDNYDSTITVEVVGKISGSDILLAGSNQQKKWNR